MEIKDVKPNLGKIDLVATVVAKEAPRTFEKFGKSGKVCNATLEDPSGRIMLTLWNDEVDQINIGDKVKIANGWCSEFKGQKQLSAGKFGKIEVVEGGAGTVVYTNDPSVLKAPGGDGDNDGDDGDEEEETEQLGEEELIE